jgi:hypothetical protein
MNKSYITCLECGTVNLNNDYCINCGVIVDVVLKRRLEREKKIQERIEQEEKKKKEPNKIELFLENGAEHSNILVRVFFQVVHSIWVFFAIVIGALISLVVAAAAG